jgi:predicted permease
MKSFDFFLERAHACLAKIVLPSELFSEYGRQIEEAFKDLLCEARATGRYLPTVRAFFREVLGLVRSSLTYHRDARVNRRQRRPTRRLFRTRGDGLIVSLVSDVRYSLRLLRKSHGFTATVVLTLALGVGATTAVFSVVSALLLNPLPFPDADHLVVLWQGRHGKGIDKDWLSPVHYLAVRDGSDVFDALTLCGGGRATMTGRGVSTELGHFFVSSSFFEIFGGAPVLGRVFDERDDSGDTPIVAVLTHSLWQSAYGADPDVVGRSITLNARDYEIVGVLSPEFVLANENFPTVGGARHLDVLLSPLYSEQEMAEQEGNENWNVFGRVKPGVSIEQVQASLDPVADHVTELYEEPGTGFFIRAVPMLEEVVGKVQRGLVVLLVSATLLLLIACCNVANLLLSRSNERQAELGIRLAVGAARVRLIRQLLTESALLALIGGGLGVVLAVGGVAFMRRVGELSLPRLAEISVNGNVLAFAAAVTMSTTIVFGLLPAFRLSGINVVDVVKNGGRGSLGSGVDWSRFNLSSGLVVAEIALSLVLLIGAGLLTRSMVALQRVDPGFNAEQLLTFRYSLRGAVYDDAWRRTAVVNELEQRLSSLPGVASVGVTTVLPFSSGVSWGEVNVEGYVPPAGEGEILIADNRVVTPGYFHTMGIPLMRGRVFDHRDRSDGPYVTVVDQQFAEHVFGESDPIGRRIAGEGREWAEIVGVVPAVRDKALNAESHITAYYPHAQYRAGWGYFVLKTTVEPGSLLGAVRQAVAEVDDRIPVVDPLSMSQRVAGSLAPRRFSMLTLRAFSTVAMILAAVGIYGLISYRVCQSTRELGMRMALGAPRGAIVRMVLAHSMVLAGIGLVLGLVGAVGVTTLMQAMLFGVSAIDGLTYAAVSAFLVVTVLLACVLPAKRATNLDPLDALRVK